MKSCLLVQAHVSSMARVKADSAQLSALSPPAAHSKYGSESVRVEFLIQPTKYYVHITGI